MPAPANLEPASEAGSAAGFGSASAAGSASAERVESIAPIERVALVVGTTAGGTGAHVRMLAAGFAGRGIGVSVLGPAPVEAAFGFGALTGVTFAPVEFGDRPRLGDLAAVLRLRRLLGPGPGRTRRRRPANDAVPGRTVLDGPTVAGVAGWPDVVHAHGLRAGALAVLALAGLPGRPRRGGRPGLVVTAHNGPPIGGGARLVVYRLLERVVARGADLVLCVSPDLEARMRAAGARRVGRAIVPSADPGPAPASESGPAPPTPDGGAPLPFTPADGAPSATTSASDAAATPVAIPGIAPGDPSAARRPLVLAVGRLAAQKDFDTLLQAASRWQDLDPVPLLAIAGEGPLDGELRARAASLSVDAAFLGNRDDVPGLLAAATVFVLPSRWEGQPLILQEALRAGAAIVATRVGGVPDLVGDNAVVLVASGDVQALAAAVRAVLADVSLADRLRAAAAARGAALPTAADAVAAALAAYDQALAPT